MNKNIKHSAKSEHWMTPKELVRKSQIVLANESVPIDLDPCASKIGKSFAKYNLVTNGENMENWIDSNWDGPITVFINPPGGLWKPTKNIKDQRSMAAKFWFELMKFRDTGRLRGAIFLGFSLELLQSCQSFLCAHPLDFYCCFPKKRIAFIDPTTGKGTSPTHGNVIVYVTGVEDASDDFISEFSELGYIHTPAGFGV